MNRHLLKKCRWFLAAPLLSSAAALATEFYAAPTGSSSGDGSLANPWDLATALNESAVQPGDTIWLRGGTYVGTFTSYITGTANSPIIVRQYPGERATIDGNYGGNLPTLTIQGSYAWFWGFEVFNSDTTSRYTEDGENPPLRGVGVDLYSTGTKLINMVIHDTSQGVFTASGDHGNEVYGSLVYYNGYDSPDRGHGHGIYAQNDGSVVKAVRDNIIFDQFGWGIHAYAEGGRLDNLEFQGNTSFDNGGLSQVSGWTANILLGGTTHPATNPKILDNYTHNSAFAGSNNLGYSAGCTNAVVSNNYLDSGTAFKLIDCTNVAMTGNTFYGAISGFSQSQFPNNTFYSSQPTGTKIFIRPNVYEAGRANITIYNWDLHDTVDVDVSTILAPGASYVIRNAQDFFGAPVVSGTYDGTPIAVPMSGLSIATPVGAPAPARSGPEFNAFVLTSTLGPYEFFDVPQASPFHAAIHTLAANAVTAGCGGGNFCPTAPISRAQMAVFLLKAKHGSAFAPPAATGNVFQDVPASAFAAAWIERVSAEGISSGCGGGKYCPGAAVTRAQMAVFLLKGLLGPTYAPPAATGTKFSDVPSNAFAAAWIEDLKARGITSGCGGGKYCPASPSTRGQMAVFLVSTFSLQ